MIIKVCGMRDGQNIREVEAVHPDMMGFVFWSGSRHFVSEKPDYLPETCRVGVFVNSTPEYICSIAQEYGLNRIQLHGTESAELCQTVHELTGLPITKAVSISSVIDLSQIGQYEDEDAVDMLLFDTKCVIWGGCGQEFDWSILDNYKGSKPFMLAGGIGPGMEERIMAIHHPQFAGIDLNSRFETEPSNKEISKLSVFINNIRNYEQNE